MERNTRLGIKEARKFSKSFGRPMEGPTQVWKAVREVAGGRSRTCFIQGPKGRGHVSFQLWKDKLQV